MSSDSPTYNVLTNPAPRSPWSARNIILLIFLLFVLIFPKGGLKIGQVPITWGYVVLVAIAIAHIPKKLVSGSIFFLDRERWTVLAALVPFQVVTTASLFLLGFLETGFAISLLSGFIALPWIVVWLFSDFVETLDLRFFAKVFRIGVLAVASYGIVLFGTKIVTGHFVEVPYLTVNANDVGHLEEKDNDRGFAFKLISTYNNGNVYGASILMILPLYAIVEKRRWRVAVVKVSLLLTLSRTAWIGLVLNELLNVFYVHAPPLRVLAGAAVNRRWLRQLTKSGTIVIIILVTVAVGVSLAGFKANFLMDKNLGGRVDQLRLLRNVTLFPSKTFDSVTEIVYASILSQFGIVGLISFMLAIATPIFLSVCGFVANSSSRYKKSITSGLVIYLVIAASDGAMLFIPVLLFYWSLVSLLVARGNALSNAAGAVPA